MKNSYLPDSNRRSFIKSTLLAGLGLSFNIQPVFSRSSEMKNIGIIGLDTSHSIAFTKFINAGSKDSMDGFQVIAAYPEGSRDIESSVSRIPQYTEEMQKMGIAIVDTIDDLLLQTDFILLETNDGRLHLEQAKQVLKSRKPLFIDKPMTASLSEAIEIFRIAEENSTPVFSSSSLRYCPGAQESRRGEEIGQILGAETYSPMTIEPTHPDLFWYGIHGVELLFTVMQTGCLSIKRLSSDHTDLVTGRWEGERFGTFRGIKKGFRNYGGTAFGESGIKTLGPFEGYAPLVKVILEFFRTGEVPVRPEETLEILAFMEAADLSKERDGGWVNLEEIFQKALKK